MLPTDETESLGLCVLARFALGSRDGLLVLFRFSRCECGDSAGMDAELGKDVACVSSVVGACCSLAFFRGKAGPSSLLFRLAMV